MQWNVRRPAMTTHPTHPLLEDKPGSSPSNRSLERGVEILRAFRPGSEMLSNGELAERTGLPKATVSRLTHTLVATGLLQRDERQRAYRLAPAVLSLGHAMHSGSSVLAVAAPKMRALAEQRHINVGLAAPDRDEMVYLASFRYRRSVAWRNVVSGQRVPIELTSLGRAYLAAVGEARRKALLAVFRQRRGAQWPALAREIDAALRNVQQHGHCAASWQPQVVAIATPLLLPQGLFALNVSVSTTETMADVVAALSGALLALAEEIRSALQSQADGLLT